MRLNVIMNKLKSKIFIDGGDPDETAEAKQLLGHIDGQTTNPSLVAKNPKVKSRIEAGEKFSLEELLAEYKKIIGQIEEATPDGAISIEVYADEQTKAEEMLEQARDFTSWAKNSYVKLPTTTEGLKAGEVLAKDMNLNFTLCFSQQQAAAVYTATRDSGRKHFVSPFIGRLDDNGQNGMDLIANILRMYESGDMHINLLAASLRNLDHMLECLRLKSPAITTPFKVFKLWADTDFALPQADFDYKFEGEAIEYEELDLSKSWQEFNIQHDLTDNGLAKFAEDWNALLK
jgi:transaldolase